MEGVPCSIDHCIRRWQTASSCLLGGIRFTQDGSLGRAAAAPSTHGGGSGCCRAAAAGSGAAISIPHPRLVERRRSGSSRHFPLKSNRGRVSKKGRCSGWAESLAWALTRAGCRRPGRRPAALRPAALRPAVMHPAALRRAARPTAGGGQPAPSRPRFRVARVARECGVARGGAAQGAAQSRAPDEPAAVGGPVPVAARSDVAGGASARGARAAAG